jgi:hypothetical protein
MIGGVEMVSKNDVIRQESGSMDSVVCLDANLEMLESVLWLEDPVRYDDASISDSIGSGCGG